MHRHHTIPPSLFSAESGKPFRSCLDCGSPLCEVESGYVIQKVYSCSKTIMEISICQPCHEKLQSEYSDESRGKIWDYFLDHANFADRLKKFSPIPVGNIDPWINHCLTCRTTRTSAEEFVVAAHCIGDQLIYGETPFMICFRCMNSIVDLLSESSQDTYDRWLDRCLPMAPVMTKKHRKVRILV